MVKRRTKKKPVRPFKPNWQVYNKLLQHPKWQKRRLKVFERDRWACRKCRSKTKTLHLHHLKYTKKYPWLEPMKNLITYCKDCHKRTHKK